MDENQQISWLNNCYVNELILTNYSKEKAVKETVKRYVNYGQVFSITVLKGFLHFAETYSIKNLKQLVDKSKDKEVGR